MRNLACVAILADSAAKHYQIYAPSDAELTNILKTEAFYQRAMWQAVKDLYNGFDIRAFEDTMVELISGQMRRAWNDGMRSLGLDPKTDQTPEGEDELQSIMLNEVAYVTRLANEIVTAAKAGEPIDQFRARVDMWVNRYPDTVNRAIQFYSQTGQRLQWHLGATEEHCPTCAALDGMIAFASEWETAGFHPQSPPNPMLDCGGWRCDCSLDPTDTRRSPNALTRLLDIAAARSV